MSGSDFDGGYLGPFAVSAVCSVLRERRASADSQGTVAGEEGDPEVYDEPVGPGSTTSFPRSPILRS